MQGQQRRAHSPPLHIEEYLWHWIEYLTFFSSPNNFISRISMKIPKTKSIPEVDSNNIFANICKERSCALLFWYFVICSCSFISSLNLICFVFPYWKNNPILRELWYKKSILSPTLSIEQYQVDSWLCKVKWENPPDSQTVTKWNVFKLNTGGTL